MGVYMDEIRQSPEHFLNEIEKEKQNQNRGHLKIFFGYAAGVGKTYAMLKAAHSVKRHGIMSLPAILNLMPVLRPLHL